MSFRVTILVLLLSCAVSHADSVTNTATARLDETLRRSFHVGVVRPDGTGPILYRRHGRTLLSATVPLQGFDLSTLGTNSTIGLRIGDFAWTQRLGSDHAWRPGRRIVRGHGFDEDTLTHVPAFMARWTTNELHLRARGRFETYFGNIASGRLAVALDYLGAPTARQTNRESCLIFLHRVADDAPTMTNSLYSVADIPLLIRVQTKVIPTRVGSATSGTVRVKTQLE